MKQFIKLSFATLFIYSSLFTNDLVDTLEQTKRQMEKAILSDRKATALAHELKAAQHKRRQFEEETGIDQLIQKIADLRKKACELQHTDPDITPLRKKLDSVTHTISKTSKKYRDEMRKLMQLSEKYGPESKEAAAIKKKVEEVRKSAHKKTEKERLQQQRLTKEIRKHPAHGNLIKEARPLSLKLHQKYVLHKNSITNSNKLLAEKSKKLYDATRHNAQIRKLRKELNHQRRELLEKDPCAYLQVKPSWIDPIL